VGSCTTSKSHTSPRTKSGTNFPTGCSICFMLCCICYFAYLYWCSAYLLPFSCSWCGWFMLWWCSVVYFFVFLVVGVVSCSGVHAHYLLIFYNSSMLFTSFLFLLLLLTFHVLRQLHSTTMEVDVWVILLTALFLDYSNSIPCALLLFLVVVVSWYAAYIA
jgi:hypothetical protein